MGGWALLPKGIDLPCYEAWQDRENLRNPKGLMSRLWRWGRCYRIPEGNDACSVDNGFATAFAVQAC